jgi:AraC-like DNA-binding protein
MDNAYYSTKYDPDHRPVIKVGSSGLTIANAHPLRLMVREPSLMKKVDHYTVSNGALRLTALFFELLNRQFPIRLIHQKVSSRFPTDFAEAASVHVNHLNRSLKGITGKTTSQLIAERIAGEAQTLLKYSEWNVCEIGYCLGFEEGPHFINFFKKNTHMSPSAYRKMVRQDANIYQ